MSSQSVPHLQLTLLYTHVDTMYILLFAEYFYAVSLSNVRGVMREKKLFVVGTEDELVASVNQAHEQVADMGAVLG